MAHLAQPWSRGQWVSALENVLWLTLMGHAAAVLAERRLFHDGVVPMSVWPTAVDLFVALVVVLVGEHVGVLLHEAGHALFALLVGAGVKAVYLGQGRAQLHLDLPVQGDRRLCVSVRAYPGRGATVPRRRVSAGAGAWITAGGPLADLAGLLVAVVVVAPAFRGTQALSLADELLVGLALTQTTRLLRNVVPHATCGRFNDGGKLFLSAGRAGAKDPAPTPFERWEDTARSSGAGDPQPALEMTSALLSQWEPGTKQHLELSAVMAVHLGRSGRFVEATRHLDAALDQATDPRLRQRLRAARADAVLSDAILGDAELSAAGCRSLRADVDPALGPELRHTNALLLLAEGRAGEAAHEAMLALREGAALAPVDRAAVVATVVIGLARSGERTHARTWLEDVPVWSAWRPSAERSLAD